MLLHGPLTIRAADRVLYGSEATWAAWDALRAEHGSELAAMATAHRAEGRAANERACERAQIHGAGSTGGEWFGEEI